MDLEPIGKPRLLPGCRFFFAGKKAPTRAPADREKPDHVGVAQRRNKAFRGRRRQQGRRQAVKNRTMLACPDEGIRPCGEEGANKGAFP